MRQVKEVTNKLIIKPTWDVESRWRSVCAPILYILGIIMGFSPPLLS